VAIDSTSQGRLILGLGVSHRSIVEGVYQRAMARPRDLLRQYVTTVRRVVTGQGVAGALVPPQAAAYGVPIYIAALNWASMGQSLIRKIEGHDPGLSGNGCVREAVHSITPVKNCPIPLRPFLAL
jgi:Luciferase-like monooxygenase